MAERAALLEALEQAHVSWRSLGPADGEYAVDGLRPDLVAEPSSVAELAATVAAAGASGATVLPRGGGTQTGLGNPPRSADLVVSTGRLARLLEYEPANLTATVEAGLPLAALQSALAAHGQFLPLEAPAPDRATIGGLVATNAAGPRRFGFGSARDLLIGIQVVTADGKVVRSGGRVVKNVAGYDLNKLYVGSLGTLGILTELTFKVSPRPAVEATLVAPYPSVAAASAAVRELLRSTLQPQAIELLSAEAAAVVGLADGPSADGCLLAVLVGGLEPAVRRQASDLARLAEASGAADRREIGHAGSAALWPRVADLPGGAALRCKASVPPAAVPIAWECLADLGRALDARPALWAHAGSGIVYARWPDDLAIEPIAGRAAEALEIARQRLAAHSGSLVVEEAPSALKARLDVWGYAGDALPVMRAIKARLDPQGILNPGRFVGGI